MLPVSVAEKAGVMPETGLLNASRRVIAIDEEAIPSAATGLVPVIVEVTTAGVPAVNVTEPPDFETGVSIERVFSSALVDARLQVESPFTSDGVHDP